VDGEILLDLDYSEDSKAEVDLNVVMTGEEAFVELQGTAEGKTFAKKELDEMLDIATSGIQQLIGIQAESLLIPPKPKELGFLRE
jgi:ribonuclease PH